MLFVVWWHSKANHWSAAILWPKWRIKISILLPHTPASSAATLVAKAAVNPQCIPTNNNNDNNTNKLLTKEDFTKKKTSNNNKKKQFEVNKKFLFFFLIN